MKLIPCYLYWEFKSNRAICLDILAPHGWFFLMGWIDLGVYWRLTNKRIRLLQDQLFNNTTSVQLMINWPLFLRSLMIPTGLLVSFNSQISINNSPLLFWIWSFDIMSGYSIQRMMRSDYWKHRRSKPWYGSYFLWSCIPIISVWRGLFLFFPWNQISK